MGKATAVANPNIAFVKSWGKSDEALNLSAGASLSMNLAALTTAATVGFGPELVGDIVAVDGQPAMEEFRTRVLAHLDRVRAMSRIDHRARVAIRSDFPPGTGLGSPASAFAALTLATSVAAGLDLEDDSLSRLARRASGSACRSVPGGFVEWAGDTNSTSFGRQIAPPAHWDLTDVIAVVSHEPKRVASREGHRAAGTSPMHTIRLTCVAEQLGAARSAVLACDLETLGSIAEADSLALHAVMMTSKPPLLYWMPGTVAMLHSVRRWRADGLNCYFSVDAGPNVHCLCDAESAGEVAGRIEALAEVEDTVVSRPGEGVRLVDFHLF